MHTKNGSRVEKTGAENAIVPLECGVVAMSSHTAILPESDGGGGGSCSILSVAIP